MPKINAEEILKKSITELAEAFNWSRQARTSMVCLVHGCRYYARHGESKAKKRKELDDLEGKTTLRDVLRVLEEEYVKIHPANYNNERGFTTFSDKHKSWLNLFVELGLTRLDSIVLPQRTVTPEILRSIPREELLEKDARILGTLTHRALDYYCYTTDGPPELPYPTIKTLLSTPPLVSKDGLIATRKLLAELGFGTEDGIFMKADTEQNIVEILSKEEHITEEQAKLVATIAIKRGWIKILSV